VSDFFFHVQPDSLNCGLFSPRSFAGIWTYDCPHVVDPVYPIAMDDKYGEIVFRGLVSLVPGLKTYFTDPKYNWRDLVRVDTGYYCKTPENLPLIGPSGKVQGLFVCGALSGIGIMSSQAAGELAANSVANFVCKEQTPLPTYASNFSPSRYTDPEFLTRSQNLNPKSGQL